MIRNTVMQESRETQQADPTLVLDLTEEAIVCDICGDEGNEDELVVCSNCPDGAEHIYCMRVRLNKLPEGDWICEDCMVRFGCIKSESQNEGVSSMSHLLTKRSGQPLHAQFGKKERVAKGSSISPRSSKPCYNSSKNFENGKMKATNNLTFAPCAYVDKKRKYIVESRSNTKKRVLEKRVTFTKLSKQCYQSLLRGGPQFQNLGKSKLEVSHSVSFVKHSSSSFDKKLESPKVQSQTNARGFSYVKQSHSSSQETHDLPKLRSQSKIACDKYPQLKLGSFNNGDLQAKERLAKGGYSEKQKFGRYLASNETTKGTDATRVLKFMSTSIISSEKLNATHFEENRNKIQRAKLPAKATATMKEHNFSTGIGSNESSMFDTTIPLQDIIIPEFDSIWLGKFQIHRCEDNVYMHKGLQANLSNHASPKVLEVVDKLPKIIILEELPRNWMWPSQFVERQPTEENIGLYFFAQDFTRYKRYYEKLMRHMTKNDLALKGNLYGVELLIFPSNVLPEKSQRWNNMLFLWGVFRERKVNYSTNTLELRSQKRENQPLDHKVYHVVKNEDVEPPIEETKNANSVKVHGIRNGNENSYSPIPSSSSPLQASPIIYEDDKYMSDLQVAESMLSLNERL